MLVASADLLRRRKSPTSGVLPICSARGEQLLPICENRVNLGEMSVPQLKAELRSRDAADSGRNKRVLQHAPPRAADSAVAGGRGRVGSARPGGLGGVGAREGTRRARWTSARAASGACGATPASADLRGRTLRARGGSASLRKSTPLNLLLKNSQRGARPGSLGVFPS